MCDLTCCWCCVRFFFPKTNSHTKDTNTNNTNDKHDSKNLSPIKEESPFQDDNNDNNDNNDNHDIHHDVYALSDEDYLVDVTFLSSIKKT